MLYNKMHSINCGEGCMFADNTVFVIGAGASAEFGLPVGAGLMKQIKQNSMFRFDISLMEGVPIIWDALRERYDARGVDERLTAMREIHRSIDLAGSIDEFINRHYNDPIIAEVGKLQIAYAISNAEAKSILARTKEHDEHFDWELLKPTWIRTFAQLLFEGIRNDEVEHVGDNITIICFNYDRCIEKYLSDAIVKTFKDVNVDQARQIVGRMKIIHPYGSLGTLSDLSFGGKLYPQKLYDISENLVTWSESVKSERKTETASAMMDATAIVFLGFAFAPQNMELLTLPTSRPRRELDYPVEEYATGFGYNDVIDRRLKSKIMNLYPQDDVLSWDSIHVQYEMKCAHFMQTHSMALSA